MFWEERKRERESELDAISDPSWLYFKLHTGA